ncbi:sensor histidine kinase [Uliginosibacterium sp. H1]|uniref:sensor histidine kinase n=1 Tax=Uliginosibacterium sp. H1 TaxID=3114757 RepID=UPI002E186115|nr:sensor histidine kinase N-terminal domain-containing protein [Uliginosibacterium sp. H1]
MPWRRRRARARAEGESGRGSYSLFGEILDWMLAPLLFLWPISIIATYDVASRIANQPYDNALSEQVLALSHLLRSDADGRLRVDLPQSTSRLLRADAEDTVYYQIVSPDHSLLAGDTEIPALDGSGRLPSREVFFRDGEIGGEDVRIAYMAVHDQPDSDGSFTLIQVAETRHKRNSLSARIVSGVLLPQFAIIPLAVLLVWFGLSRGIAPLGRLQGLIRSRSPGDLSPVDPGTVPEEVRPLVNAFNDMMARLEDNLQAQRRFIADAAHQMRTPLAGLKMQTELALTETDPEQVRMSLSRALTGAERATRLINQLLSLARAEASSDKVHAFEIIDIDELVRTAVAEHVPGALAKSIDIGVDSAGQRLTMPGSPVLLHEMVSNLVDNAVKYTPEGGHVTASVRASDDGQQVVIGVLDDGPGVPAEDQDRVFERFYRVLGSSVAGSGLGLAIVREIAALHGGTAFMEAPADGRGTCVRVILQRGKPPSFYTHG